MTLPFPRRRGQRANVELVAFVIAHGLKSEVDGAPIARNGGEPRLASKPTSSAPSTS